MARLLQPNEQRSFRDHLNELRNRLIWWFLTLVLFGAVALYYRESLVALVIRPLNGTLYYNSPFGGVDFLFKIILVFAFIPSLPVLSYQLLRYIEPAIPHGLSRLLPKIIFASIGLTLGSVFFSYLVGLPLIFHFLHLFENANLRPLIGTEEYLSFVIFYVALITFVIQLPLILVVVNHIVPINLKKFNRYQPFIILGMFLLAGLVTPGFDIATQLVMTAPMVVVLEASVIVIYLTNRNRINTSPVVVKLEQVAEEDYRASRYQAAMSGYQQLIKQAPNNSLAYAGLGKLLIKQAEYDKATILLRQAVKRDPTVATYQANLGIAWFGQRNYRAAVAAFKAALKIQPDKERYRQLYELSREESHKK